MSLFCEKKWYFLEKMLFKIFKTDFFRFFRFKKIWCGSKVMASFFRVRPNFDQLFGPLFWGNRVFADFVVTSRKDFQTRFLTKKGVQKVISLFWPKNVIFGDSTTEKFLQTHFLTHFLTGHFLEKWVKIKFWSGIAKIVISPILAIFGKMSKLF